LLRPRERVLLLLPPLRERLERLRPDELELDFELDRERLLDVLRVRLVRRPPFRSAAGISARATAFVRRGIRPSR
jgi:hypothetical protein